MSTGTGIEWTDATWNPIVGCTRVHAGCDHCYAVTMTHRLERMGQEKYAGLTVLNKRGERHFNGVVRTVPEALTIPLKWRKPRRVFVNSMSDLFHKDVPFEFIDRVMAVMALCPRHTFQVLTKRPERAAEYFNDETLRIGAGGQLCANVAERISAVIAEMGEPYISRAEGAAFPLPNLWLGCSVSDQATADAAIPHLLRCPAAVRFVSYEPALGPVDFGDHLRPSCYDEHGEEYFPKAIDWLIVGGESGPGARPFDVAWARSAIEQCRAAGVACFVKQLGRVVGETNPSGESVRAWGDTLIVKSDDGVRYMLKDSHGGDWSEWPEDLRVREWPEAAS